MARIRSVHPSLFTDEAWVSCSPLARILYIGLMTDADDQGLFEWKPLQIRMRLLPGDNADIPALLAELAAVNLIAELNSGGKKLGAIRYFRRFQRPKKPNAVFLLPDDWRTYVGLKDDGSELDASEEDAVLPEGELGQQMEDGGGNRKREESNDPSLSAGKPARASKGTSKRKGQEPLPKGYPDEDAIRDAEGQVAKAGVTLDVQLEARKFRSYSLTHDRRAANWAEAWAGWITIEIDRAPKAVEAAPAPQAPTWEGPAELYSLVKLKSPEALWLLARCGWRPETQTIVAPDSVIHERIKRDVMFYLKGVKLVLADARAA